MLCQDTPAASVLFNTIFVPYLVFTHVLWRHRAKIIHRSFWLPSEICTKPHFKVLEFPWGRNTFLVFCCSPASLKEGSVTRKGLIPALGPGHSMGADGWATPSIPPSLPRCTKGANPWYCPPPHITKVFRLYQTRWKNVGADFSCSSRAKHE